MIKIVCAINLVGPKTLHAYELNHNDDKQREEVQRIQTRESGETKFCESGTFLIDVGVGENESGDAPKNLNREFTVDISRSQQVPQWLD